MARRYWVVRYKTILHTGSIVVKDRDVGVKLFATKKLAVEWIVEQLEARGLAEVWLDEQGIEGDE